MATPGPAHLFVAKSPAPVLAPPGATGSVFGANDTGVILGANDTGAILGANSTGTIRG